MQRSSYPRWMSERPTGHPPRWFVVMAAVALGVIVALVMVVLVLVLLLGISVLWEALDW